LDLQPLLLELRFGEAEFGEGNVATLHPEEDGFASADVELFVQAVDVLDPHPPQLLLELRFGEAELGEGDVVGLHPVADGVAAVRVGNVALVELLVQAVDVFDAHEEPSFIVVGGFTVYYNTLKTVYCQGWSKEDRKVSVS
jgi:hypothetical protein